MSDTQKQDAYNWLMGYFAGYGFSDEAISKLNILYGNTPVSEDILDKQISFLHMDVRTSNCLNNYHRYYGNEGNPIITIRDLVRKTDCDMLIIPNFGRRSLNLLKEELAKHKLRFGMDV